ncbi:MAG: hypothetical protein ABSG29_04245 [Steroidobacteraceae bacterium]|jgi:hypothetical protein
MTLAAGRAPLAARRWPRAANCMSENGETRRTVWLTMSASHNQRVSQGIG